MQTVTVESTCKTLKKEEAPFPWSKWQSALTFDEVKKQTMTECHRMLYTIIRTGEFMFPLQDFKIYTNFENVIELLL